MTGPKESGRYGATAQVVWINVFACLAIFCQEIRLADTSVGPVRLEYMFTYPLLLNLIFMLRGLYLDIRFILCLVALAAASYWNVVHGKNEFVLLFKNVFGMFQNGALYYMVLKANKFKVMPLFRVYLAMAVPVAAFGLIQEAAYVVGFRPLYDLSWLIPFYLPGTPSGVFMRTHSILPEPASFVFGLTPAVFASIHSWIEPKNRLMPLWKSLVLFTAFIFSFSSVGYIGLGIMLVVILINLRKFAYIIAAAIALPGMAFLAYTVVPDVHFRAQNAIELASGEMNLDGMDLSNIALIANFHVAMASFEENPWIGSGLGSHAVSFDRHIGSLADVEKLFDANKTILNRDDAASMMLRLISETGILGVSLMLLFIFRCWLSRKQDPTHRLWVVNNGVFSLMVLMLFRYGNYFALGSFLFFWLLFASKREALQTGTEEGLTAVSTPLDGPEIRR